MVVIFKRLVFKVNLLNDNTYRWIYATVIVSSFGQMSKLHNKEIFDLLNEKRVFVFPRGGAEGDKNKNEWVTKASIPHFFHGIINLYHTIISLIL